MRFASPLETVLSVLTELCRRAPQFVERNIKVIGISADALQEHYEWIDDIIEIGNKTAPTCVEYPIVRPFLPCTLHLLTLAQIADPDRKVSRMYKMVDEQDMTNVSANGEMNTVSLDATSRVPSSPSFPVQIRTVFFIDPKKTIRAMMLYPASVGRDFDEVLRCVVCFAIRMRTSLILCA